MKKSIYNIYMWGFFAFILIIGISWKLLTMQDYDLSYPDHFQGDDDVEFGEVAVNIKDKILPNSIKDICVEVLHAYPELSNTKIHIFFTKTVGPTMQARPPWYFPFISKASRWYEIRISNNEALDKGIRISELSEEVLKGWIAHELGHIMDYDRRSNWQLINFVLGYLLSPEFKEGAERTADLYALQHGYADELVCTKQFILSNRNLSSAYKARILRYYLSPEEVLKLIGREVEVPLMPE